MKWNDECECNCGDRDRRIGEERECELCSSRESHADPSIERERERYELCDEEMRESRERDSRRENMLFVIV